MYAIRSYYVLLRGDEEGALALVEERLREDPDDPHALENYRYASTAVLLQRGRDALFDGRVEEALVV